MIHNIVNEIIGEYTNFKNANTDAHYLNWWRTQLQRAYMQGQLEEINKQQVCTKTNTTTTATTSSGK